MTPNPGHLPPDAEGKRVIVELRSGSVCGREPVTSTAPRGWAADGRNGCRWTLLGRPHDILFYEVIS